MMQPFLLVLAMIALVGFITYSYQAICPTLLPQERMRQADAVFAAKAVRIIPGLPTRDIVMQVGEVWKGEVPAEITFHTNDYELNGEYLLFALAHKGQFYVSRCGGRYPYATSAAIRSELGVPVRK
jgi:hypothetical protein